MPSLTTAHVLPILLLIGSNVFMTFAWYGHLSYKSTAIGLAILASWMIALPEYMLAVPANRIGSAVYSTAELKTMQEVITKESLTWNHAIGFALIAAGAFFIFHAKG